MFSVFFFGWLLFENYFGSCDVVTTQMTAGTKLMMKAAPRCQSNFIRPLNGWRSDLSHYGLLFVFHVTGNIRQPFSLPLSHSLFGAVMSCLVSLLNFQSPRAPAFTLVALTPPANIFQFSERCRLLHKDKCVDY